jgi:hypothetical protein
VVCSREAKFAVWRVTCELCFHEAHATPPPPDEYGFDVRARTSRDIIPSRAHSPLHTITIPLSPLQHCGNYSMINAAFPQAAAAAIFSVLETCLRARHRKQFNSWTELYHRLAATRPCCPANRYFPCRHRRSISLSASGPCCSAALAKRAVRTWGRPTMWVRRTRKTLGRQTAGPEVRRTIMIDWF